MRYRYLRNDVAGFNEALADAVRRHKEYWTADEDRTHNILGDVTGDAEDSGLDQDRRKPEPALGIRRAALSPPTPWFRPGAPGCGSCRRSGRH
ncbi:Imm49 family immunity protein [Streptomyces sp. NPDC002587]